MDSVLLSRPAMSHSSTSTSPRRTSPNPLVNPHQHGTATVPHSVEGNPATERSYNPFGRGILGNRTGRQSRASVAQGSGPSHYIPSGRYVPIDLQPIATTQHQWGDRRPSGPASPQASIRSGQYEHHNEPLAERPRGRNSLIRSCSALLKQKKAKRKLITLLTSTVFLILVLAVYIALHYSNTQLGQELHILLIFMILILAIVFCHSLIRFFMITMRGRNGTIAANRVPSRAGPAGYAQPDSPIHVMLAGDEENMTETGIIREKVTAPPPAYGLWRSSVRMNPDLLYWQRVDEMNSRKINGSLKRGASRKTTLPRPPSYTSDDGIDYVLDAQPRSFAPTTPTSQSPEHH